MIGPEASADVVQTAAVVALLRGGTRPVTHYADLIERAGSGHAVLEQEHGLLASELARRAAADVASWIESGIRPLTVLDREYPENLRGVHDRPPMIFVAGELQAADARAVAVIGSRRASPAGLEGARALVLDLVDFDYAIVSGLAAGIDTAAHTTALERGGRTIAVVGTGLSRCYPPQNAALQRRIGAEGALVSQFWPDTPPSRETFPQRNAVMSGLSLATVIVEAGHTSGARIQARQALGHGRPVLLLSSLLDQPWARELAQRPGVHVIRSPHEVGPLVEHLSSTEAPVA